MSGIFWLFLNWGKYRQSGLKMGLTVLNLIIVGIGACLVSVIKAEGENAANKHTVRYGFVGFWKSVRILLYFKSFSIYANKKSIHDDSTGASFSCADTS